MITRREDSIHTKLLDRVHCTEEICQLVDRGMDENSPWVHDRAAGDGSVIPTADELKAGLDLYEELHRKLGDADAEWERERKKSVCRWRHAGVAPAVLDRPVIHLAWIAPANVMAGRLAGRMRAGRLHGDGVQKQRQEGENRDKVAHSPWNRTPSLWLGLPRRPADLVKFRR